MAADVDSTPRFQSSVRRWQIKVVAGVLVALALSLLASPAAYAVEDLARDKPASASSAEDGWEAGVGPQFANDGSTKTRWSSSYVNGQWWRVDLGSVRTVSRVWINWTGAHASSYRIDVSRDGVDYETVWQGAANDADWKVHDFSPREVRYVRFYGVARATGYGFSFSDFQVYDLSGGGATDPDPGPPGCGKVTAWRAPGSLPQSDAAAADCVRPATETRSRNYGANHYTPTDSELASFRANYSRNNPLLPHVTGRFTGTTDEIIQWTAHKWGIPEDVVRAEFVQESWWNQSGLGDRRDGVDASLYPSQARIDSDSVYQSMGISQLKWRPDGSQNPGIEPLRWKSTAFAADYYAAGIRFYYDGLCNFCGSGYSGGQAWQSIGAYYSPGPWWNADAQYYVSTVQRRLSDRTWEQPGF